MNMVPYITRSPMFTKPPHQSFQRLAASPNYHHWTLSPTSWTVSLFPTPAPHILTCITILLEKLTTIRRYRDDALLNVIRISQSSELTPLNKADFAIGLSHIHALLFYQGLKVLWFNMLYTAFLNDDVEPIVLAFPNVIHLHLSHSPVIREAVYAP